jgi:hypothetical protein
MLSLHLWHNAVDLRISVGQRLRVPWFEVIDETSPISDPLPFYREIIDVTAF